LVRALRRESASAIAYWWGVSICTVWRGRTALNVGEFTDGTRALHSRRISERLLDEDALAAALKQLHTPGVVARRAAARRGKPMPTHVKIAIAKAKRGRKLSLETRRRMSEAQKRRDPATQVLGVVWTSEEEALLGTMTDRDVGEAIGRTTHAV